MPAPKRPSCSPFLWPLALNLDAGLISKPTPARVDLGADRHGRDALDHEPGDRRRLRGPRGFEVFVPFGELDEDLAADRRHLRRRARHHRARRRAAARRTRRRRWSPSPSGLPRRWRPPGSCRPASGTPSPSVSSRRGRSSRGRGRGRGGRLPVPAPAWPPTSRACRRRQRSGSRRPRPRRTAPGRRSVPAPLAPCRPRARSPVASRSPTVQHALRRAALPGHAGTSPRRPTRRRPALADRGRGHGLRRRPPAPTRRRSMSVTSATRHGRRLAESDLS